MNVVETRFTELEILKKAVSAEYLPDVLRYSGEPYDYEFLFDQSAIRYTLAGGI